MTTLRRELRIKFSDILGKYLKDVLIPEKDAIALVEELVLAVDAVKSPKFDLSQSDPAWRILFGGVDVAESALAEDKLIENALQTFERDMRVPGNWSWYPAKTSEEKAWKYLRDFVVEKYREDPKCFQTYQTWRTQPFARGAMSNLAIKRNPENFPASWSDFLASNAMYGKKKGEPEVDDFGAPISY